MTFLEFFIYSTASNLIYSGLFVGYTVLRQKYTQNKLDKLIKSGKIQVMTMEDALDQLSGDKKTWN